MQSTESFAVDDPKRHEGIGGSEVGTALGVNPYMSKVELYLVKRGETEAFKGNDATELGHLLEPWILDKYEQKEQITLNRPKDLVFRHPKLSWLFAHVDGLVIGQKRGVDAKSSGLMNWKAAKNFGEEGSNQVPHSIIAQCALYMSIFDYPRWDVAALIAGTGVKYYRIDRDLELEADMLERLKVFWFDHVKKGIPPESSNLADTDLIYQSHNEDPIECTPEIYQDFLRLHDCKDDIKAAKERAEMHEHNIKSFIGLHSELVDFEGKELATWRTGAEKEYFDLEGFKDDNPKLHHQYLKSKPGCRRFYLKTLKD
jgi:putative phage-type endonuclease